MRGRLLIVDDDEDVRTAMREVLTFLVPGLHVSICASGREALALLHAAPFDAVVTDYQMPGMDGLALLDAAHELRPALPVVVATGFTADATRELALRRGAFSFLAKPFSPDDLADAACRAVRSGVRRGRGRLRPGPSMSA